MSVPYKFQRIKEKVFRDPVHNYIHVQNQMILDLIDSKEVQRLRRIKQLGTSSFTFHGGEHSRFTHSLGVYENARQMTDIFKRKYSKQVIGEDDGWDDGRERLVTLAAALLHDVGHGPYSHTFEHIFHTNHEHVTVDIITNPETEVYQILNRVEEGFPEKVASVIQKTYPNPQVVQMISSQIDADRMEYLLRDAYFTGTEYGNFDITRIFRVIRPYKEGIAFEVSGMHAVEDYIVSRYQMYMQIYFHPVSRGMEVVLTNVLQRARDLYDEHTDYFQKTSPRLVPFFKGNWTLQDYLKLDDGVLNTYFSEWAEYKDEILSDLAKRFLNRKPFKSVRYTEVTEKYLQNLKEILSNLGYNTNYYAATNSSFDLPYDFYRPGSTKRAQQIEMMQPDGTLRELSTLSPLVAALAGTTRGDNRFYFPKEALIQSDLFEELSNEFKSYIHNGEIKGD
jgi:HD superfamily phosphohydrolase